MKVIKKLKNALHWCLHYKVMFVTVDSNFTVEHRIFRQPIMSSHRNPKGLRGAKIEMVIFDEYTEEAPEL